MEYRADSFATPERRAAVYQLLGTAWPRLPDCMAPLEKAGDPWHEVSTPFVLWEGDHPVAHAGVLEMDLVVEGESVPVCGIHAVVTHPDHRMRGHMRNVMERAMEFAAAQRPTTILFGDPPLYDRYGFRLAPRHVFRAPAPDVAKTAPLRPLGDDLPWLRALLHDRTPVSSLLGVERSAHMFVCDSVLGFGGFDRVFRTDDYAIVYKLLDDTLLLLDVIARELPPLHDILARIPEPFTRIRFGFTPDRFEVDGVEATPLDSDPVMVKGPWPAGDAPRDFPAMAVC